MTSHNFTNYYLAIQRILAGNTKHYISSITGAVNLFSVSALSTPLTQNALNRTSLIAFSTPGDVLEKLSFVNVY